MKTVVGQVVSSKSISLSKAAKILSKFASSENEASPAYSAYLKRATASFNELVQLHKEYKSSGSGHKVKKLQHSDGVVTERTVESVKNQSEDGLLKEIGTSKRKERQGANKGDGEGRSTDVELNVDEETKRHKSKNRGDEDEGMNNAGRSAVKLEVQKAERIVDGNVADVEGARKKSKKKRESNEVVVATIENEHYGNFDAVNTSGLKNDTDSFDGSNETKKKKKRDKHGAEKCEVASDIKKEVQSHHPHSQNDSNGQAIETGKKHGDKQKKHNKENERENGGKLETEAANKESKKRKHESVAAGELDGSQEKHKSKKKKR